MSTGRKKSLSALVALAALTTGLLAACASNPGISAAPADSAPAASAPAISAPAIAQVGGDGSFARVAEDGIRVCTTADSPYNVPVNGKYEGIDADMVTEALSRLGLTKVTYVEGPWDSMVGNLQSERCDFLQTNIHYNAERAKVIDFTVPVYFYGDTLMVKKGNPLGLQTWNDLAGHTVGAMLGNEYVDWLNKRTDLAGVKTYKTWPELIIDVEQGRVDAAIVDGVVSSYYIATTPGAAVELPKGYIPQEDLSAWTRFGVPLGYHDLANAFSNVFDQMRVDGTLATILAKYGISSQAIQVYKGMGG